MADMGSHDKKKRKRAKKGARDLRFQDLELAGGQRKQKRKEYLKARKIKSKRARNSESSEFPGRQEVKFGEVVDAPPKLSFPKGLKTALDASTERRRLQAIEAYRSQKGWESRLGIHLPLVSEGHSQ
ncbi:unnamed protein product [Spirodela intermedia]|uniref:Uncharacterized protein n=1 Tax=Spirodela intermedia TaxID=51605 RepID=A0A7I8K593_SPIIN|nr:unnamed protein product [Spirodela intermedia]CAA7391764.1 unnamed protein product [Spirodela intermedia]